MPKKKDENEAAFSALQELIARDEERDGAPRKPSASTEKLSYRVKAGRKGGKKGGKIRAAKLSSKVKSSIAKKAAKARWKSKPTSR
nr:histone H1 [Nitrosomonas nitrosa]